MSTSTKWIIGIIVAIIVILIIIFTGGDKKESAAGEPIKIGFIGALSGVGVPVGEAELKGAQLAVAEINEGGGILGRSVELIPEDVSLDKLKVTASAVRKLIDIDKVVAIVGPQWDEPAAILAPIIEQEQVPTISPDLTNDLEKERSFEYLFSTWLDSRVGIRKLLEFAEKQGWNNIAIIRPVAGGFYQFTSDLFTKFAPEYNVSIVINETVGNPLETDFRTQLTKVKPSNPDALFMIITDFTACPLLRQVQELGINVPVLSTEAGGNPAILEQCPELTNNLYFSTPVQTQRYKIFASSFAKQFGREPLFPTAVTSYDAVGVIAQALERTNLEGGSALKDELAKTTDYQGASLDTVSFDEKGFVITHDDAFEVQTGKDGEFIKAE